LIPGLLYVDHLRERGAALFRAARERDLEGVVAKWRRDCYETDGVSTAWLKIKNPNYSQMAGWRDVFGTRRDRHQATRRDWHRPELRLIPA
jgi:ATP-dependent DNA ligase